MDRAVIAVDADHAELGFDAARLRRIDAHFGRYVDDGRLPCFLAVVARDGRVVHVAAQGCAPDAVFRLFSMTKPITSVAAMALWEEGAFELTDPVARFLPEFAEARVLGAAAPPAEPMRMWHLLTHTSGLTYGFLQANEVDAAYRAAGFEWGTPPGLDLAACCREWARLPLLFAPGEEWNYSVATDVLGRVLEVLDGKPLDAVLQDRVLGPLGMAETAFWAPPERAGRLVPLHLADPETKLAVRRPGVGDAALAPPDCLSGGGGLVGTAADYHRFTRLVLGEGELEGTRILGPRTVRRMATNHLPGGLDLERFGRKLFAETSFDGVGFGLGFSVTIDPVRTLTAGSRGELAWGGAASTAFWVDPVERVTAMFFTQLLPSSTHPIRPQLRQLVYQALVAD